MVKKKLIARRLKEGDSCAWCHSTNSADMTVDHIVPVSLFHRFGFVDMNTDKDNLQLMCRKCNELKGHLLDHKNPKTYELLKKMLERWASLHDLKREKRVYAFRNLPVQSNYEETVWRV